MYMYKWLALQEASKESLEYEPKTLNFHFFNINLVLCVADM